MDGPARCYVECPERREEWRTANFDRLCFAARRSNAAARAIAKQLRRLIERDRVPDVVQSVNRRTAVNAEIVGHVRNV